MGEDSSTGGLDVSAADVSGGESVISWDNEAAGNIATGDSWAQGANDLASQAANDQAAGWDTFAENESNQAASWQANADSSYGLAQTDLGIAGDLSSSMDLSGVTQPSAIPDSYLSSPDAVDTGDITSIL